MSCSDNDAASSLACPPWPDNRRHRRALPPLGQPALHLLNLGALGRALDLVGQLGDPRVNALAWPAGCRSSRRPWRVVRNHMFGRTLRPHRCGALRPLPFMPGAAGRRNRTCLCSAGCPLARNRLLLQPAVDDQRNQGPPAARKSGFLRHRCDDSLLVVVPHLPIPLWVYHDNHDDQVGRNELSHPHGRPVMTCASWRGRESRTNLNRIDGVAGERQLRDRASQGSSFRRTSLPRISSPAVEATGLYRDTGPAGTSCRRGPTRRRRGRRRMQVVSGFERACGSAVDGSGPCSSIIGSGWRFVPRVRPW